MPQLDKVTFYVQYSFMIWSFLVFHYFIKHTVVRTIFITLKIRELYADSFVIYQEMSVYFFHHISILHFLNFSRFMKFYTIFLNKFTNLFSFSAKKRTLELEQDFFSDSFNYIQRKNALLNSIEFSLSKK